MAPRPENRPFPVEKMKIFKNGWTEKYCQNIVWPAVLDFDNYYVGEMLAENDFARLLAMTLA